jgi:hypothetical protein
MHGANGFRDHELGARRQTGRRLGGERHHPRNRLAVLGIAFTGSMLASKYTTALSPQLSAFPGPIRAAATRSLGEALGLAPRLGPAGEQLADTSRSAFLSAS